MKVGVLASGGGTNLQALLEAERRGELRPAEIAVVGVNVEGCGALERARAAGRETFVLEHKRFTSREAFDGALADALTSRGVELVVLAGFMRLLTDVFLSAFRERVINIHPALLPAFPGTSGPRQALAYGTKFAGCTVHFVDSGTDTGPVIAQAVVPVLEGDDEAALQARILVEEHRLLPAVVRAVAEGRVRVEGRRVSIDGGPPPGLADGRLRSL